MEKALGLLNDFGISHELIVASAHRSPLKVKQLAQAAEKKYDLLIAAAGGAAHLPGVIAAYTTLPVIGVPIASKAVEGLDALFSIVQMPPGIPVASVAIDGAKNAAILAAQILALKYPYLTTKLKQLKKKMARGIKI
jgi:5-(carboxyamino)imidazole ribonucleotide mutase